jgi:hypothetical protein
MQPGSTPDVALDAQYRRDGFICVRGALTPDEVAYARATIDAAFVAAGEPKALLPVRCFADERIYRWMFQPRIVAALKEVLEPNYSVTPTLIVPRNQFGMAARRYLGLKRPGWHVDSGSEGHAPWLLAADYRFMKCGIYLQDNSAAHGGGVDIVRGGHRFPLRTGNPRLDFGLKTLSNQLGIVTAWQRVALQAGDFLAFDSRLPHRSTLPEQPGAGAPPKYVIYWDSCRTAYAASFIADRAARGAKEIAIDPFFAQMASLAYPDDYPPGFVARVEAAGIRVAMAEPATMRALRQSLNAHAD